MAAPRYRLGLFTGLVAGLFGGITACADKPAAPSAAADTTVANAATDVVLASDAAAQPDIAPAEASPVTDAVLDTAADALPEATLDTPADVAKETAAVSPCAGQTCSGHGKCYPTYSKPLCKCDTGYWLLGTTQCHPDDMVHACHPNPCSEPDKGICNLSGANAANCSCGPGFDDVGGVCLFQTCPQVAGHTAITVYDTTGAGVVAGFDPLVEGDKFKLRVDVVGLAGTGTVTVELQGSNVTFDPTAWTWDGNKIAVVQKATILSASVVLTPGSHALEGSATLDTALFPLGLNARLTGPSGCEIPQSRSGARIGPLGLLDPKGFGCIDLDRTRSVQFTNDVVEKNTGEYGLKNGTTSDYSPAGSIVSTVTQCFSRQTDRAIFLAGDGLGVLPWAVDNDVVIELYDHQPVKGDKPLAVVYTGTDVVSSTQGWPMLVGPKPDVPGTHFGIPNGAPFGYSAGHVRLDSLIPKGQARWLRLVALDQGVVGRLTRIYVMAMPGSEAPRQCLGNANCLSTAGAVNAGCIDGQCLGVACGGGCPADQFCVQGFCTSQCDQGGGQCAAGTVCKVRGCVAVGAPGVCDASNKDQDCPLGQICHWGRCEPGCHHPRKQDQSYAQDPSFCQGNKPALCPHCPKPSQGCWNNVCGECEIDAHCAAGQLCVDRACVGP